MNSWLVYFLKNAHYRRLMLNKYYDELIYGIFFFGVLSNLFLYRWLQERKKQKQNERVNELVK